MTEPLSAIQQRLREYVHGPDKCRVGCECGFAGSTERHPIFGTPEEFSRTIDEINAMLSRWRWNHEARIP